MKRRFEFNYGFDTFRGDLFGGITSTVVALPVSLAFGVASGLGAAAGLYGAIAVGFFAAVFGGTRSQISGPTAPMAVAMAVIIASHASNLTEALAVVMLGGLLQVLLGVLRIGRFIAYTPHVVVSGFMTGIGIIVMLIQTLPFLGAPTASGGPMGAIRALPEAVQNINFSALVIAVVTLAHRRRLAAPPAALHPRSPGGPDRRHAARRAGAARCPGNRGLADRTATTASGAAVRRVPSARPAAGDHPCPARVRGQPAHFAGRRFADRYAAQPGSGTGGPGHRQSGRGSVRWRARRRRDHGHRDQHPRRGERPACRACCGRFCCWRSCWD